MQSIQEIPDDVLQIISELENNHFRAYIVGGCVRDILLGKTPKDWDITTNATPDEMKRVFEYYQLIPTGEKYGTMVVRLNDVSYEITTFRKDGTYGDGRRPDKVEFSRYLKDDLCRRDLTINSMAYDPESGLIDYFNGYYDLRHGIIRCVGNPIDRFNEDSLRIMRAIRLAVNLDFEISTETIHAIWECGENLKNVSQERKRDELFKILKGIKDLNKDTLHYRKLCQMVEYIIKRTIPEFQMLAQVTHNNPYHYLDVFNHTMSMLFMADTDDLEILLTILFHDIGKIVARTFDEKRLTNHYYNHAAASVKISTDIMSYLKFDKKTTNRVLQLVEAHGFILKAGLRNAKKLLTKLGFDLCLKLVQFQLLDKATHRWNSQSEYNDWLLEVAKLQDMWKDIIANGDALTVKDLAINGNDLIEMGFKQGKEIGETLTKCLNLVMEYPDLNNKDELKVYIKAIE